MLLGTITSELMFTFCYAATECEKNVDEKGIL